MREVALRGKTHISDIAKIFLVGAKKDSLDVLYVYKKKFDKLKNNVVAPIAFRIIYYKSHIKYDI